LKAIYISLIKEYREEENEGIITEHVEGGEKAQTPIQGREEFTPS
jgi:hypothetical protein